MVLLVLIAVFAPFALMLPMAFLGRRLGPRTGWIALAAPLLSVTALILLARQTSAQAALVVELPWIPSLGLNLTFLVDGLSLFFGLVVSGMGLLIVFYATFYLDAHYAHLGRFYAYLLLFMGSMLATVLAGNLLLLFVAWELTGIASFLLIGFLHEKNDSRSGARQALLVTASTGLAMLAGIVLVGLQAGTFELAALLSGPITGTSREVMTIAFVLVAIGAFGKSAQFPFHFWLPNAMAAPTPVSAYLHSATMVKLGVFMIARVFPLFREVDLWMPLLVTICFGTMALAALLALLSHDLKAILAFSTVTTLAYLMGFYGMGPAAGVRGDLLHISSHVFFKGALFMLAGIIDHATGTRDVRELGGLRRKSPALAVLWVVVAASMAGVPGTLGFVSKEYMLQAQVAFLAEGTGYAVYALALGVIALTLKAAFSFRLIGHVLGGPVPAGVQEHYHAPAWPQLLPPALLAAATLLFGWWPAGLAAGLEQLAVTGLHDPETLKFKPFPDHWALEVGLGFGILAVGTMIYLTLGRRRWARLAIPRGLRVDQLFEAGVHALPIGAKHVTAFLRSDRAFDYLPIVLSTLLVLVGGYLVSVGESVIPPRPRWEEFHGLRSFVVALIAIAVVLVVTLRRWTGQLISLSIVGFMITFYFVLFRAPDLAMTQILVESATLLLVLLLLARFPRSTEFRGIGGRWAPRRLFAVVLSTGVGALMTWLVVLGLSPRSAEVAGDFYLGATVPLAHGTNAVNTILVDFRGFDTLLEITVLVIASLGAAGLFLRYRRTPAEYAAGPMGPAGYGVRVSPPADEGGEK